MSGSSKFSNIKHRKGAQDARRSQLYSRLSHDIAVAARQGGRDPSTNATLRTALQKARSHNMPNTSIQRALNRGGPSGAELKKAVYEALDSKGIALIIEALTDNKNRTTSFVRSTLNKHGCTLMRAGGVTHRFDHLGTFDCVGVSDPDALVLALMEEGLEDYDITSERIRLVSSRETFGQIQDALHSAGVQPVSAKLVWVARVDLTVPVERWTSLQRLADLLMAHDDIQGVTHDARLNSA